MEIPILSSLCWARCLSTSACNRPPASLAGSAESAVRYADLLILGVPSLWI